MSGPHKPGGMSLARFWAASAKVQAPDGRLVTATPHREEARLIAALDTQRGTILDLLALWAKKLGKGFFANVCGRWILLADPLERQPRIIVVSSFDEDQSNLIGAQMREGIERDPWARKHCKITRQEIVYTEPMRDPKTGGRYSIDHRVLFLPKDTRGNTGLEVHVNIKDEYWTAGDAAHDESLIISPTRPYGFNLCLSYYGPAATMRTGVPLYDLLERAKNRDPRVLSYVGGTGDDAPWRVAPWISEKWVDDQRAAFATCPSRFKRTVLNVPVSGDGDGLISVLELQAAIDSSLTEPARGEPGRTYAIGADLGYAGDFTHVSVIHLDADARFVVDAERTWVGTTAQPVSFQQVQREILSLAERFNVRRVLIDQWNAKLLAEALQSRGLSVRMVTCEQSRLDKIITTIKAAFARRQIRIAPSQTVLIEQLESVRVVESRSAKRDLLKFAPSGSGPAAGLHDDAVVSLGLAMQALEEVGYRAGERRRPIGCVASTVLGHMTSCCLTGGDGLPNQHGPSICGTCEKWLDVRAAWHAAGPAGGDIRSFAANYWHARPPVVWFC